MCALQLDYWTDRREAFGLLDVVRENERPAYAVRPCRDARDGLAGDPGEDREHQLEEVVQARLNRPARKGRARLEAGEPAP